MRSDGDGNMRDERERILFLIGKVENKIILKPIHLELQWVLGCIYKTPLFMVAKLQPSWNQVLTM